MGRYEVGMGRYGRYLLVTPVLGNIYWYTDISSILQYHFWSHL